MHVLVHSLYVTTVFTWYLYLGRGGNAWIPAACLLCNALPSRDHTGLEHVESWCEESVQIERGGRRWGWSQAQPVCPLSVGAQLRTGTRSGAGAAAGRRWPEALAWDRWARRGWLVSAGASYSNSPKSGAVRKTGPARTRMWWGVKEKGAWWLLQVQTGSAASQRAAHVIHVEFNFPGKVSAGAWCPDPIFLRVLLIIVLLCLWVCSQQRQRIVTHLNICTLDSSFGRSRAHGMAVTCTSLNNFLVKAFGFMHVDTRLSCRFIQIDIFQVKNSFCHTSVLITGVLSFHAIFFSLLISITHGTCLITNLC